MLGLAARPAESQPDQHFDQHQREGRDDLIHPSSATSSSTPAPSNEQTWSCADPRTNHVRRRSRPNAPVKREDVRPCDGSFPGSMLCGDLSLPGVTATLSPLRTRRLGQGAADDRVVCREAAVKRDRCHVPLDLDPVSDAAH